MEGGDGRGGLQSCISSPLSSLLPLWSQSQLERCPEDPTSPGPLPQTSLPRQLPNPPCQVLCRGSPSTCVKRFPGPGRTRGWVRPKKLC